MIPAGVPIQRAADAKLMVVDADGGVTHRARAEFPDLVREGDIVIANDASTLPASLTGVHLPTGAPVELRLAGRETLLPEGVRRFMAIVFGAGDFRTPTEQRSPPPVLQPGDTLQLGPLSADVVRMLGHPRLIEVHFRDSVAEIWEGVARHGRPIQYRVSLGTTGDLGYLDADCGPAGRVRAAVGGLHPRLERDRVTPFTRCAVCHPDPRGGDLIDRRRGTRSTSAVRRAVLHPAINGRAD